KIAKKIKEMAETKDGDKDILAKYNTDSTTVVSIKTAMFLPGQDSNVDKMNNKVGMGDDILNADGSVTFVKIIRLVPPSNKTLDEARGYVISAYQDELEKQWIEELHKKYPVVVDQKVFNSMVK
ncbi:MAG: hypothetical protein ACHQFW_03895, partial [Chitinophagales bacterium]